MAEEAEDRVIAQDRMKTPSPTVTVWWYTTITIIISNYGYVACIVTVYYHQFIINITSKSIH